MGSYYGEYRWPLIYISLLAGVMLTIVPTGARLKRGRLGMVVLALSLVALAAQGIWMWWNARWDFVQQSTEVSGGVPWSMLPVENVPFPDMPGAAAKNEAWDRLTYICPALLLIWGVARWVSRKPAVGIWICQTIFVTGALVAVLGLAMRWTNAEAAYWMSAEKGSQYNLFFATFRSPAIATVYMNIALALGLSLFLRALCGVLRDRRGLGFAMLYLVGVVVLFNGVMGAGSKAGMVMTGVTLILWGVMNWRALWDVLKQSASLLPSGSPLERNLLFGAVALILILSGLSWAETTVVRWQDAMDKEYTTLDARSAINTVQIKMMKDPDWSVLGFGPGSFHPLFPYYSHNAELKGIVVYAHNDHFQTLVEWGSVGFALFVVLIAGACLILLSHSYAAEKGGLSRRGRVMQRGMFIAILVSLIHACVDFPYQIESIAITLAALLGVAWGGVGYGRRSSKKPKAEQEEEVVPA
ncbi:O-Antigen ligase [Rubritalea squalenifaciens DSM 18772]|uniref:O-Antigen ligase n=1 Tax=Rubritalea squalenifaciens DSM 18772 TaxID=1123071 RepID=A0A1M6R047_9BACT|nr:O-antigen ligase family protein [Rubritalea squalenifaciens]SHK25861.1 O-Antigen ligase [Rubritalea squalenifaciens DSM 18772]